jgi:hypothetical protein
MVRNDLSLTWRDDSPVDVKSWDGEESMNTDVGDGPWDFQS